MVNPIIISFALGIVSFFATGIDDTMTYAGSYMHNGERKHKQLIAAGIFIGTGIALAIAKVAGEIMMQVPHRHLIGGGILIVLGSYIFWKSEYLSKKPKSAVPHVEIKLTRPAPRFVFGFKYLLLGVTIFFATGIDDIIAYSNIMIAHSGWVWIALGVFVATFISLILANWISKSIKNVAKPERIGGLIIIVIGLLLALQLL